jgi:hypothetical protein
MWAVATTDDYDEWYLSLGDRDREEVIAKVLLLQTLGPHLTRPHADTLKGSKHSNMKELRGKTAASVIRIAFAFDPARSAILLIGGDKSGVSEKRFYKQLISRADKLFDEHLRTLPRKD